MTSLARLALACALVASVSVTAHAAEPPTVHVRVSKAKDCNTDGGKVMCSVGVQTVAKGLLYGLEDEPIPCEGVKPGKYTLALTYEYNDGSVLFHSHTAARSDYDTKKVLTSPLKDEGTLTDPWGKPLRKKLNLPACVRERALPRLAGLILRYLDVIRPIDPEADVRATYEVKLEIRAAE